MYLLSVFYNFSVPNAIAGRDSVDIEIFGMEGVPDADIISKELERQSASNPKKRNKPDDLSSALSSVLGYTAPLPAASFEPVLSNQSDWYVFDFILNKLSSFPPPSWAPQTSAMTFIPQPLPSHSSDEPFISPSDALDEIIPPQIKDDDVDAQNNDENEPSSTQPPSSQILLAAAPATNQTATFSNPYSYTSPTFFAPPPVIVGVPNEIVPLNPQAMAYQTMNGFEGQVDHMLPMTDKPPGHPQYSLPIPSVMKQTLSDYSSVPGYSSTPQHFYPPPFYTVPFIDPYAQSNSSAPVTISARPQSAVVNFMELQKPSSSQLVYDDNNTSPVSNRKY